MMVKQIQKYILSYSRTHTGAYRFPEDSHAMENIKRKIATGELKTEKTLEERQTSGQLFK